MNLMALTVIRAVASSRSKDFRFITVQLHRADHRRSRSSLGVSARSISNRRDMVNGARAPIYVQIELLVHTLTTALCGRFTMAAVCDSERTTG